MSLQNIVAVLESYRGREKTMRTVQFGLLFATPLASENARVALQTISTQLSLGRIILRLFDDCSMLAYSLSIVKSGKGKDAIIRYLELMKTVVDQLYFPVEHIAYARDIKVFKGSSGPVWVISLCLWGLSLSLAILRSLRQIALLKQQSKGATKEEEEKLDAQYQGELLTLIMQGSDLLLALNWMPFRPWSKPFPVWQVRQYRSWRPWHTPFPLWQVGFLGLVSSLIGFSKLLSTRRS